VAEIQLARIEVEDEDPPLVCMRCGAPAAAYKTKRFHWHPPWMYALIVIPIAYHIAASGATLKMQVPIPLCDRHRYHFGRRLAAMVVGLLVMFGLAFTGFILATSAPQPGPQQTTGHMFFLATALSVPILLVLVIVLRRTAIRPTEITGKWVTLTNVHEDFVRAVEERRQRGSARAIGAARTSTGAQPVATVELAEERRPCPFCGQWIKVQAIKCRFCGEYLDED
jgi:hypothetical protein